MGNCFTRAFDKGRKDIDENHNGKINAGEAIAAGKKIVKGAKIVGEVIEDVTGKDIPGVGENKTPTPRKK